MTASTFLITGGAGFLGINLIRYLLERGHPVVSLDIADFNYPERNRVKAIKGDIRDRSSVDRAMEGVQIVVHAAAALPLYKKRGHLLHRPRRHAQCAAIGLRAWR